MSESRALIEDGSAAGSHRVLSGLQSLLKRLYDVDLGYDVYDFLVTDRRELAGVVRHDHRRAPEEELLLAQTAEGAGMSLYIDERVLSRLERSDPMGSLTDGNLADFCTALEGVSHFVYSAWKLGADAPVSLLELETQAEVDKYAAAIFLIADQQGGGYPAHVHARLFDRVDFDSRLEAEEYERYRTAHRCAANFCRRLERRYVGRSGARIEALVRELRKFYRLGNTEKLRYAMA